MAEGRTADETAEKGTDMATEERTDWAELRRQRMAEPGAAEADDAARLAFELGAAVRALRDERGWSSPSWPRRQG
jgi:hypothetical protein